ncbi:hypothetical protein SBRCBS47491_002993 [Sporothrix bragantina]|uniref:Parasitic phase-specific protein PSP-1 n=1 Tax=Sporothrix bragantina TaxID=671064 RepID=A0ABP0BBK2_9PEZI
MAELPDGLIAYGPDANCTLAICPVEWSILRYQPSIPASAVFIALFGIALVVHLYEGIRWRQTLGSFAIPMILGLTDEIIGYIGRIIMHGNPFSFNGFLIQIICITTAPVFFCAAIYVTLARTINFLDPSLARFNPKFFYWFFIPCDIISLVFQAAGGALSSVTTGSNAAGIDMTLFGLSFQVFTLVVFILCTADYQIRYYRRHNGFSTHVPNAGRFRLFLLGLWGAILFILIRCVYRIDELSEGYSGEIFHNEGLFYGLESAMMVLAVFSLAIGQPGFGLQGVAQEAYTAPGTEMNSVQGSKPPSV